MNSDFFNNFVNTIADRLNYDWQPFRIITLINQTAAQFAPSLPSQIQRWNMPEDMTEWQANIDTLRSFATHRPDWLRNNVVQHFSLAAAAALNVQIIPSAAASIRINNRINVESGDYTYFRQIPIKLKAILNPGWEIADFGGQNTVNLTITPQAQQTVILSARLKIPNNVRIQKNGNNVNLSWDASSGSDLLPG